MSVQTETFLASGTWVAPADVSSIDVECWGGGGGGATSYSGGGGGGGGGAYSKKVSVAVTGGNSYNFKRKIDLGKKDIVL
jgi:hypothetical protein